MLLFVEKTTKYIDFAINRLKDSIYEEIADLSMAGFVTKEPVSFANKTKGEEMTFEVDRKWGELWDCGWIHVTGEIPVKAVGKSVVMLFDCGGEALVYDENGCPCRGLTNVNSEFSPEHGLPGKRVFRLSENAVGGEKINLWLDIACNDLFGNYSGGKIKQASVAICHVERRALYYDAYVLFDLMRCLDNTSAHYKSILYALSEAMTAIENIDNQNIAKARNILSKELQKKGGDPSLSITAIGHAHMDLAWLWPIRETKRKVARTFATVDDLMNRYPSYHFGVSQPQQLRWLKDGYPHLYERIKKHILNKRIEIQGDMWVEADSNIPSGESLVRQFLYGRKFYMDEYGHISNMLWLPDVFGYNGNLPQIMTKSGVKYFMTQKLSWNEHNRFPHQTFEWEGIDGSTVLTHMLPEETYNSSAAPRSINKAEKNYSDAGLCDEALLLFGIGDGGGGPGPEHLERLERIEDLKGISPVKQGFARDFFNRIEKNRSKYATYRGELYLEKHQGTYTSQAKSKYYNRKIEIALKNLEYFASIAMLYGEAYPVETLQAWWDEVLLYQFHDILPGTSISRVYDESVARYEIIYNEIIEETDKYIQKYLTHASYEPSSLKLLINTTSFPRAEWVETGESQYELIQIPPMGISAVPQSNGNTGQSQLSSMIANGNILSNSYIKLTFNENGAISDIYDIETGRMILKHGTVANVLTVYQDVCANNWDIDIYYRNRKAGYFLLISSTAYMDGVRAVMRQTYQFGDSALTQEISITPESKLITFKTNLDWHEDLKMIRTSFDVNVFTDAVTCDIQFGKIKRSAVNNNQFDAAQFEICAHKWIDYSQKDYGVALINDCKYGYYAKHGVLDLNLIRSQNFPGVDADKGSHVFTYALFPHIGDDVEGEVNKTAYLFNEPVIVKMPLHTKTYQNITSSFIYTDANNICIETVKKAESENALIVRVYEFGGLTSTISLFLPSLVKKAVLCSLVEEDINELPMTSNSITLSFSPFCVHTVKLLLT